MSVDAKKYESLASEQARIAEIGRIVNSTLNLDEVFSAFAEQVRELVPYDRLMITALATDDLILRTQFVDGVEFEDSPLGRVSPVGDDVVFKQVYEQKKHFVARGANYHAYKQGRPEEEARWDAGFRSALFVPVVWQDDAVGGMGFRSRSPDAFNEHEIELAGQIANQIAGAIAAANQYSKLERELLDRERIAEIGRIVSSSISLNDVFTEFAEQARELVPFDRLVIAEVSTDGSEMVERFIAGVGADDPSPGRRHPLNGEGVVPDVHFLSTGKDYEVFARNNSAETERYDAGFRSVFAAPIAWQGVGIGVLAFRSFDHEAFGKRELRLGLQISRLIAGAIATAGQYGALERESEERERIAEIGRIVSSAVNMNEVFAAFCDQARNLVPCDRIAISTLSPDGSELVDRYIGGLDIEGSVPGRGIPADRTGLYKHIVNENQYFVTQADDYEQFVKGDRSEEARFDAGLRSMLIVRLAWQGEYYGAITFRSLNPTAFGTHEIELAQQVSNQVAGAIATSNQFMNLERESEERERIAEIGRIVSSTLNIDEVLAAVAEQVRELVPFDRLVVSTFTGNEFEIRERFTAGTGESETGKIFQIPAAHHSLFTTIFEQKSHFVVAGEGLEKFAQSSPDEQERWEAGFRSFLTIPLVWQQTVSGLLSFRSYSETAFGEREIELAWQVSNQVAGAIATADQYALLERDSHERERIAEIGRIVSSNLDLDEVFSSFAEQARELVAFDRLVIAVASEDGSELVDRLIDGVEMANSAVGSRYSIPANEMYQILTTRNHHFVANGEEYTNYKLGDPAEEVRRAAGLKSMLVIPLIWQGTFVGAISFRSTDPIAYGERGIARAWQIANQVAGAIATSNQYALLERESKERERIAEIGRIVSSSQNLDDVFAAFFNEARELIPFDRLAVGLIDSHRNLIYGVHVGGLRFGQPDFDKPMDLDGSALPALVFEEHQTVVANRKELERIAETDENNGSRSGLAAGLRSVMFVPVVQQGTIVAALVFRSKLPDPYSDREINLAEQIASQIAGVIASGQQYALVEQESTERQRLAEEQSRIAEIGRIVSSTLELADVYPAIAEHARILVPSDRLVISLYSADRSDLIEQFIDGIEVEGSVVGRRIPVERNDVFERLVNDQQYFLTNDEENTDYRSGSAEENSRVSVGFKAMLIIPLLWQGSVYGTITFRSFENGAFGSREIDSASQIGAQVAGAIATSNQFTQLQQDALERQVLASISLRASQSTGLNELFEGLADDIAEIIPYARLEITRNEFGQAKLVPIFVRGETENHWQVGTIYPSTNSPADIEFAEERKAQIWRDSFRLETIEYGLPEWSDIARLGNADPGTEEHEFCSWTDVPVGVPNEIPSAFISVRIPGRDKYSQHDQDLLSQIAIQIAPAIDNARAYDLLEVSEANFKDLVERTHVLVARLDKEGCFTYLNPSWYQSLGYSPEEMVSRSFSEFHPERVLEESLGYWEQVMNGESVETETVFTRKDGSELIAAIYVSPVYDSEGAIIGARAAGVDITAERAAQADLRIQAAALEAASDAIVILRPDTTMEYVNEAFVRQTGYSKAEASNAISPFMRSDKDSDAVYDRLWERARRGEVGRATVTTRRKDGTEFPTDIFMSPVFDDEGTITRFVAIRRDMTEQIEAENERAVRRDLDMQNVELQQITEQRDDFFSSVSHELRTPLTSVMAFADILSRNRTHNLSTTQLDHLQVIKRNSHSLNDLVEDMLDISRLNSNKLRIEPRPTELDELIASVVKSLGPTVKERKQKLNVESDTKGVWLDADPGRLIQIISNLVTNSCKYSPNRTSITITTACKDGLVEIQVIDEGYGMTPEELDLLFSPFSRSARTEIRRETGTGLGMSISKTLVELHGGEIYAESELDIGTTVTVRLPNIVDAPAASSEFTV